MNYDQRLALNSLKSKNKELLDELKEAQVNVYTLTTQLRTHEQLVVEHFSNEVALKDGEIKMLREQLVSYSLYCEEHHKRAEKTSDMIGRQLAWVNCALGGKDYFNNQIKNDLPLMNE